MTHRDLVSQIMLHLSPAALVWANNTGALKDATGRLVRYGLPGSPDILACIKGRFVGIECKVGRDRQSPQQKRFGETLERHGGIYVLARSIDDVASRLSMEGLL